MLKDSSEGDIIDFYGPAIMILWVKLKSIARKQTVGANLLAGIKYDGEMP